MLVNFCFRDDTLNLHAPLYDGAIIDVTVAQAIIMPYIICNFINALHIKRKMDFRLIEAIQS